MANKSIDDAFLHTPRAEFLPASVRNLADIREALPIGHSQTNSQPDVVRQMLVWLNPKQGDNVLDVGSGSGWTAALLAHIVGPQGTVYAVERIPELLRFGKRNIRNAGIKNVRFYRAGSTLGLPAHAPYDRILVSASATELPRDLLDQLRIGGTMVIPVHHDIVVVRRDADGNVRTKAFPGYVFVPLVP
jgi:protein-L-isoaspartate(D-aspartate) O-methyltransferase